MSPRPQSRRQGSFPSKSVFVEGMLKSRFRGHGRESSDDSNTASSNDSRGTSGGAFKAEVQNAVTRRWQGGFSGSRANGESRLDIVLCVCVHNTRIVSDPFQPSRIYYSLSRVKEPLKQQGNCWS